MEQLADDPFAIRVFNTNPSAPEEGHTYVWSDARWYERIEEPGGAVAFSLIAETEDDLRGRLLERGAEVSEIDEEFARQVRGEFQETMPLDMYPEDLSDAPPFQEQKVSEEEGGL
ncbi:MAG: hypothetical protein WD533_07495 [Dehalococcoidia bacterium]